MRSFLVPRSKDQETRENRERERTSEDSLDSSRRRACCDEWGEATEEAARAGGIRCDRATSPSAAPEGAEETEVRSRATDERPETLPPLSLDRGRARGEEASRDATPGAPRDYPFLTCPPEGREAEEEEVPGCVTSEEVRAWGVVFGAGGTEPEGRERLRSAYVRFFAKSSHCAEDHPTQKSQVMFLVHTFPLHLVQVGWGSLSKEDRNAPHFRPPTPRQILNSLDII